MGDKRGSVERYQEFIEMTDNEFLPIQGELLQIDSVSETTKRKILESVWIGKDNKLLDAMFDFYSPEAKKIIDVCSNKRRMWKGSITASKVSYYDIDAAMLPDVVCAWDSLPDANNSVDVIVYDPPHLPVAAASEKSLTRYGVDYGLGRSVKADNIAQMHEPFLNEAKRVLKPDGLIFAKIKDYIHNHKYQWNANYFNESVIASGMTPCDLIIKRDPCGGNLKSGRWVKAHHAKNTHCYWVVVRNSSRCEAR
jgi:SAM-dependent methyltransferase